MSNSSVYERYKNKKDNESTKLNHENNREGGVLDRYKRGRAQQEIAKINYALNELSLESDRLNKSYRTRFADKDGNYINAYRADTQNALSSYEQSKAKLEKQAQDIMDSLSAYEKYLDADSVKSLRDYLTAYNSDLQSMYDTYRADHDYFSQWADEDAYKEYQKYREYEEMSSQELEEAIRKATDEKEAYEKSKGGKFGVFLDSFLSGTLDAAKSFAGQERAPSDATTPFDYDAHIEKLNSMRVQKAIEDEYNTLDEETKSQITDIMVGGDNDGIDTISGQIRGLLEIGGGQVGESEKAVNARKALKAKGYTDEEIRNLVDLGSRAWQSEFNRDVEEEFKNFGSKHPAAQVLQSGFTDVIGGLSGTLSTAQQYVNQLNGTGSEYGINTDTVYHAFTRGNIAADTQAKKDHNWNVGEVDAFDVLYDLGSSVADNVTRTVIGGGSTGAGVLMGTQVFNQSVIEGKEKGYSDTKAVTMALTQASIEALTEKYSIEAVLGDSKTLGRQLLKSFVAEGSEGVTSNWLNRVLDVIANGNHSEIAKAYESYISSGCSKEEALTNIVYDLGGEDLETFLLEGAAGFVMGGGVQGSRAAVAKAANAIDANKFYNKMGSNVVENNNVSQLVEEAKGLGNSRLKKLANVAESVNVEELSTKEAKKYAHQVGKLYKGVQKAQFDSLSKTSETAFRNVIKAELEKAGVADVDSTADILVKAMHNKGLTRAETKKLQSVDGRSILDKALSSPEFNKTLDAEQVKQFTEGFDKFVNTESLAGRTLTDRKADLVSKAGYKSGAEKTFVDATDEVVDSLKVNSIKGDTITLDVKLGEKNQVVAADELTFDNDYAVIISGLQSISKDFGLDVDSANRVLALWESYDGDSFDFYKTAQSGIMYGQYNQKKYFDNATFGNVPDNIRNELYNIGKEYRQKVTDTKAKAIKERSIPNGEVKVTFAEGVKYHKLTKSQKAQVDMAQIIARAFGFNLEVFRSPKVNGKSVGENGSFSPSANIMRLDIDAGTLDGKALILFTQGHELTHFIKAWSETAYKKFADFLIEKYTDKDVPLKSLLESKIENSKILAQSDKTGKHKELSYDEALEEVVCDACEDFLADPNIQQTILEIAKVDQSLADKIKNFIKNLINRLEKALRGLQGQSDAAAYTRSLDANDLQELKDLWTSALIDARENVLQAKARGGETQKNTTAEGDVKFMARSTKNGIVEYTPKEYNDFGWVAVNKILTGKELKKLYAQFSRIKLNKNYNYKNRLGEYVIPVGDEYNAIDHIVYIKGTNKHPIIRQVVGFIETISDEDRKTLTEDVLNDEYSKRFTDAFEIAEAYARKECFVRYMASDLPPYSVYRNRTRGQNSSRASYDDRERSNGKRNLSDSTGKVQNRDGIKLQDRDSLGHTLSDLNKEYSQLSQELEEIKQSEEYLAFVDNIATLPPGDELDNMMREYGRWVHRVGFYTKSKRMTEIEEEQKRIRKIIDGDAALSRDAFFKSIDKLTKKGKMEYVNKAIERYGTTDRVSLASYLMLNGEMLDFSDGQGYRVQDHREISEILNMPESANHSDSLIAFMNMGNIRMQTYGIDISKSPNQEQKSALRDIIPQIMRESEAFSVDFSDDKGYTTGSVTYPRGTSTSKILSDIDSFFKSGVVPEYESAFGDFLYQDRVTPEQDAEYVDAVNRKDVDTLEKMVVEAAEKAMPNSKVRDDNGKLRMVYHGRVSEFNVFDRSFSNIEGDFGKGYYFTSSEYDVDSNYASIEGPDLVNKIARYAEKLEYDDEFADLTYEEREEIARGKLITSEPNTITAYLNMENPVYITPNKQGTFLDFNTEYDEEYDEFGEPDGLLVDFIEALNNNAEDYSSWSNVDFSFLYEYGYEGGLYAADAVKIIKDKIIDELSDENGDYAVNEVIRLAFEDIGFDGIIDTSVYYKFRNMNGMDSGTTHYIVFNSNQIKEADLVTYDDNGNIIPLSERFNEGNNDIRYQDRPYQPSLEDLGIDYKAENDKLKADVDRLNKLLELQRTLTHGALFTKTSVDKAASLIMKEFGLHRGKSDLSEKLNALYTFVASSNDLTWDEFYDRASQVANWMIDSKPDQRYYKNPYASEVLKNIRERGITLNEKQKEEAAYYAGSLNAYRKSNIGNFRIVNEGGISLTELWEQLVEDYPGAFSQEDIEKGKKDTNLPSLIVEVIGTMRQTESVLEQMDRTQEVRKMVEKIYDTYWNVTTLHTLADKHQKEVNLLKGKHRAEMDALKEKGDENLKQAKERYREMLQKVREDKDAKMTAYKEHVAEQRHKSVEGRNKTATKNKIKRVIQALASLYNNPTKERNVKVEFQDMVDKALVMADAIFDNGNISVYDILSSDIPNLRESERGDLEKWRENQKLKAGYQRELDELEASEKLDQATHDRLLKNISECNRKLNYYSGKLKEVIEVQRGNLNDHAIQNAIDSLVSAYKSLNESTEGYAQAAYNEYVDKRLIALKEALKNTTIKTMTQTQLDELYQAYKMVLTTVRTANELFIKNKKMTVADAGEAVMREVQNVAKVTENKVAMKQSLNKFMWEELKPVYAFERIGSETFMNLYKEILRGQSVFGRDIDETVDFFQRKSKAYNYDSWDLDERRDFKLADGRTFTISLQEIMSIYAYSKREQALDHITKGGFVFDSNEFFTDTKEKGIKGKIKKVRTTVEAYRLNDETFYKVINSLTPEQKKFVDDMQDYLSTVMGAKGNEVSRVLYGIDLFREKYYFPLMSSHDFIQQTNNPAGEVALRNSGMAQATVPHARNPIVLKGFMDVWNEHVNKMSTYHAFVLPIENLNKVFNYTGYATDNKSVSVQTILNGAYGPAVNQYITTLLQDLNGGIKVQSSGNWVTKGISLFKKTAVAASFSVAIQQPTAVVRAMAMIDVKYFGHKADGVKHDEAWEELKKYAPIAVIKEMGGFDVGGGKQVGEYITAKSYKGLKKLGGLKNDRTYRDESLMLLSSKADESAWIYIWNTIKKEIADTTTYKVGSEEFLQACGERFTEVVDYTQVYDSVLSRSGFMRNKGEISKMATSFMGEPTTSFNMLYNAVLQLKRGNISKLGATKIVGATFASIILAAVAKSFIYALRDDDEDESYVEKYVQALTNSLKSDIWIHNMLPYVSDVTSLLSGWDVERTDMAILKDLKDAVDGLDSSSKSEYRKAEDLLGAGAAFFGIPLKNLMRSAREIRNGIAHVFDGVTADEGDVGDAIVESLVGETSVADVNKALEKGNTAKAKEIINELVADKVESGKTAKEAKASIKASVTSYWKDIYLQAYRDKDNAEMLRIRRILQATGLYDDVLTTCSNWIKGMKDETTETKFKKQ